MADSKSKTKADDVGADQVQAAVDEETAQGFHGVKVDPTPNEHYTVGGVIAGLPTPETDPALAGGRLGQTDVTTGEVHA